MSLATLPYQAGLPIPAQPSRSIPKLITRATQPRDCAVHTATNPFAESTIANLFERKGHEFVDLDVVVYFEATREPAMSARLRAIYRMRGTGANAS